MVVVVVWGGGLCAFWCNSIIRTEPFIELYLAGANALESHLPTKLEETCLQSGLGMRTTTSICRAAGTLPKLTPFEVVLIHFAPQAAGRHIAKPPRTGTLTGP